MSQSIVASPKEFFSLTVKEAIESTHTEATPLIENYLVNLLQFYVNADNLFDEVTEDGKRRQETLAERLLRAASAEPPLRLELFKRLGDSALYVSGFFGESLKRKVVDIDYYADMGCAAYATLAQDCEEDLYAPVYSEFSRRFLQFADVLSFIAERSFVQSNVDILRLYERYVTTGSDVAKNRLFELGFVTVPNSPSRPKQ